MVYGNWTLDLGLGLDNIFKMIYSKMKNFLHFRKVFSTKKDSPIFTIHPSCPDLDVVPGSELPGHLAAASGAHHATAAGECSDV